MFSTNRKAEHDVNQDSSLDKLTLWLIRLACLFIIIFFSGIFLAVPIVLSLIKSQYMTFSLGLKEFVKSLLEIYLT